MKQEVKFQIGDIVSFSFSFGTDLLLIIDGTPLNDIYKVLVIYTERELSFLGSIDMYSELILKRYDK